MHPKKHIALIPLILKSKGVTNAVISPGSRNAPLTEAFYKSFGKGCKSIVDERSAAYFALGMACQQKKPVVIITTSGTAVLNLAPALAEAFYLGIPLIAITADRPPEWIDQEDNQAIRQSGIFMNIKASYNLPVQMNTEEDYWYVERIINEAANVALAGKKGPVHINVPLREPLYETLPEIKDFRKIDLFSNQNFKLAEKLKGIYRDAQKILIIAGQTPKNEAINSCIEKLLADKRICVFSQAISNLPDTEGIINGDLSLTIQPENQNDLTPDLVIYLGGQVVSKRVKQYIRSLNCTQWLIHPEGHHTDTFKIMDTVIQSGAKEFLDSLINEDVEDTNAEFQQNWTTLYHKAKFIAEKLLIETQYSDLSVFYSLSKKITSDDIIFAGNSSVIRYMQLLSFNYREFFANRGTSGIDGCLSTASGIARATDRKVFAILGDLSFLYDSNALWNNSLPENLKIIVINNNGGSIFSMIEGPQTMQSFEQFFKTGHKVNISRLCEAFDVHYYHASSPDELESVFSVYNNDKSTSLLEIKTPGEAGPIIFSNFIKQLKS